VLGTAPAPDAPDAAPAAAPVAAPAAAAPAPAAPALVLGAAAAPVAASDAPVPVATPVPTALCPHAGRCQGVLPFLSQVPHAAQQGFCSCMLQRPCARVRMQSNLTVESVRLFEPHAWNEELSGWMRTRCLDALVQKVQSNAGSADLWLL
jgi:hypothetical protein